MRINLNEILARDDYKRMTENLKSITEEVAEGIRKKMDELDIKDDGDFDSGEIGADGVVVRVITVNSNSGFNKRFLGIKRYEEGNHHAYYANLEGINDTYYFTGDFNARIYGATNKEALAFLNASKKLILGLGEIEQHQVDEIQKVLDERRKQ
jgi:hypothetical protein